MKHFVITLLLTVASAIAQSPRDFQPRIAVTNSLDTPPPPAAPSLTTNLIAYWRMDETSGTRVDVEPTGTPQNLTDNNTVTSVAGVKTNAAHFVTGNAEYFSRPDSADLSVSGSFTFAFWCRVTTDQSSSGFIEKTAEYKINKDISDNIKFTVNDSVSGLSSAIDTSTTIVPSTWYLVIAWYDQNTKIPHVKVGVRGGSLGATADGPPLTNQPSDGTADFDVGIDTAIGYLDGDIDELGFWKRVLTPTEMTTLFSEVTYPFQ